MCRVESVRVVPPPIFLPPFKQKNSPLVSRSSGVISLFFKELRTSGNTIIPNAIVVAFNRSVKFEPAARNGNRVSYWEFGPGAEFEVQRNPEFPRQV